MSSFNLGIHSMNSKFVGTKYWVQSWKQLISYLEKICQWIWILCNIFEIIMKCYNQSCSYPEKDEYNWFQNISMKQINFCFAFSITTLRQISFEWNNDTFHPFHLCNIRRKHKTRDVNQRNMIEIASSVIRSHSKF